VTQEPTAPKQAAFPSPTQQFGPNFEQSPDKLKKSCGGASSRIWNWKTIWHGAASFAISCNADYFFVAVNLTGGVRQTGNTSPRV
jgi:hypothetical protein